MRPGLLRLDMDSYELVGYCIERFFALETKGAHRARPRERWQKWVCISTHLCPHRVANELLCGSPTYLRRRAMR